MYSVFLYEKEGNNVTERLVDSSIVGFLINDNSYHYRCQYFFVNKIKNLMFMRK